MGSLPANGTFGMICVNFLFLDGHGLELESLSVEPVLIY